MIVLLNGVYVDERRVIAIYPQLHDNPLGVVLVMDVPCDRPMTINIPGVTADQVADILWGSNNHDWRQWLRKLEA